jgi:hypothetical protein
MPGLLRLLLVTPSREKTTRRSRLPGQANRLDDPGRNAGRHGMVGTGLVTTASEGMLARSPISMSRTMARG